ncbi:hypothetical protein AURDEDRAFT_114974 [Auricularia subglabra TFB-10046 SS5]|nr:hypothetical protein AURDEDRAFT_114974 [Auricularia subglabra TFB-10046 SS5]
MSLPSTHENFSFPDSDVTLRSSDNILFCVHKANLSAFSVVFRDMFDIGKASNDGQPQNDPITVTETADTLALLLAMCYPATDPPVDFTSLPSAVILNCYEATVKYKIWVAGLALRSFVLPLVDKDPFLVVKLAYKLKDSVLMNAALAETLKHDILAKSVECAEKAGPLWAALLEYHYLCRMEIIDVALGLSTEPSNKQRAFDYTSCACSQHRLDPEYKRLIVEWPSLWKGHLQQRTAHFDTVPYLNCLGQILATYANGCDHNYCRESKAAWKSLRESLDSFVPKGVFKMSV